MSSCIPEVWSWMMKVVPGQLTYETCTQVMSYTFMDLIVGFWFPFQKLYLCTMQWNKEQPMREAKGLSSELSIAKGSATVTCILAETQRQAEEWESFRKREAPHMPWLENIGVVNLLADSSRAPLLVGYIFGFFWLALTWKWGKKLGKLSVIKRALDIWGLFLQKWLLSFLYCYPSEHSIFYKTDL